MIRTGFGRGGFLDGAKTRLLQGKGAQVAGSSADPPPNPATHRHEAASPDKSPAHAGFFFAVLPPPADTSRQAPTGRRRAFLDGVWTPTTEGGTHG